MLKNNQEDPNSCKFISWNKPKLGEKWDQEIEKELNKEKAAKKRATKKAKTTKKKATTRKRKTKEK